MEANPVRFLVDVQDFIEGKSHLRSCTLPSGSGTDLKWVVFFNRRFLVDAIATALFWTVVYSPVFLYTSKSLEAAFLGLGFSALLEGLLGGPYGKFLDWFRRKLAS